jgi:isopentenyl phosphate kinase
MDRLVFLKLGGSLITDKNQRYTLRLDKLAQVAREIKSVLSRQPDLHLILGHGSGSFGHYAVKEFAPFLLSQAFQGNWGEVDQGWRGFSEVWFRASQLNRRVMEALYEVDLPSIALPPSALVGSEAGVIKHWDLTALHAALEAGLMPVIYGDIVFDAVSGGAVLSTEALMFYLARQLSPQRILLAGLEAAVWADFPTRDQKVEKVTPSTVASITNGLGGSHGTDVTGGMRSKVEDMVRLVQQVPALNVQIFSGEEAGNIEKALSGECLGTLITGD